MKAYAYRRCNQEKYKPFLHHISKGKEVKTRLLKVKEPKTFPGCLTPEQVMVMLVIELEISLLSVCYTETGMRIGEVLGQGMTKELMKFMSFQRDDNVNNSRAKAGVGNSRL